MSFRELESDPGSVPDQQEHLHRILHTFDRRYPCLQLTKYDPKNVIFNLTKSCWQMCIDREGQHLPPMTRPIGEKPCLSRNALPWSRVLMKSCVVREFGPAVAKTIVPRSFDVRTGSSGMFALRHFDCTSGLPLIPNCTTKPGRTRKNRQSSQKPKSVNS